ncbi:SDR family NAD(P)-dependent oxidoreductase [Bacteroidia bacterium]|nr:SDR family NAD(P)-dependent oxidoreductase [Bacteroidia bacterium]MDB9883244.1 SDR family NAD(P)-dependent oxidoreductase [Bacteroidia bacterium]MDC1394966.1 SDR family NAD(P)-dependent oxidoreductase [Bacteroidia bacterium]
MCSLPLLLCHLLFDSLSKSNNANIIFTSSGLHQGEINFDNLEFVASFSSFKVYRQSKLGVILLCRVLAEKLKKHHISIYSPHPGMVRTELGKRAGWMSRMIFLLMGKSPEKDSQTLSYLMEEAKENLVSGEYYSDKKVTATTPQSYDLEAGSQLLDAVDTYIGKYIDPHSPLSARLD